MKELFEELDTTFLTEQYDEYLNGHISAVQEAYEWLAMNAPEVFLNYQDVIQQLIYSHDQSKYSEEEYLPYAVYFYKKGKKSKEELERFDYAWLHHQHNNPHHWQHWLLQNDEDGLKPLDMPYVYIVEMVCDHWAFSFTKGDLHEIFNWYDKNKKNMILSDQTKYIYESILDTIKKKLDNN